MKPITEDKITKCEINFFSPINERYLASFANKVEQILKSMITGKHAPVSIKGNKQQLKTFAKALGDEKRYILALSETNVANPDTINQFGAGNKSTYNPAVSSEKLSTFKLGNGYLPGDSGGN